MSRLRGLARRVLLAVGGLAFVAGALCYLLLRASLPQLEGQLAFAALDAPVEVERDAAGIPTLTARNRRDLAFATGFVHGQDRFFQMDLTRRSAAGELAELVGPAALGHDRRLRWHRFRARAGEVLARAGGRERDLLGSYAAGVNAALGEMTGRPFEYVVLKSGPAPWREEDTLLVVYAMFVDLQDERADRELERGVAARVLPPEVFDWLYPPGTRWDAPLAGAPRPEARLPGPDVYDLRGYRLRAGGPVATADAMPGSNNWAVGGELTADGRAIVANDMHLGLRAPNVFYRARLRVAGEDALDVSGVMLPGAPLVVAGSNGRIAWGFTNSYGDWSDAIVARPGSTPDRYVTPDGERAYDLHRERIEVRGAPAEELLVRETIWGPVREDATHPDGEVAVAWTAHHPEAVNLVHLELERADDVGEALGVAARMGLPAQNFVTGDAAGNIGWTIAGQIPLRSGYDASLPVDGSREAGMSGWLDPSRYPRIENPPGGRLWTANARVADAEALALIGDGGYDLGSRAAQIRDGLAARQRFEPADMLGIQLDDRALFLERWRRLLMDLLDEAASEADPARARFRAQVAGWIPRASVDSVGYRLVRGFRQRVRDRVFDMLTTPVREAHAEAVRLRISNQFEAPLWQLVSRCPPHLLTSDVESWRELLLGELDRLVSDYESMPGGIAGRHWGERNTAAIRHPLSAALPFAARWLDMPREPLAGDDNMPRVQAPTFGASERFAVAPGAEHAAYLHMPTGQSGHPLSPFYGRGHAAWVEGRPTPFLPGEPRYRLTLEPANRR